jgi:hypothetical protein
MDKGSSLPVRLTRAMLSFAVCLGAIVGSVAGCNGEDPVPQALIDSLPPETGTPSATHRPGQPCLQCHSTYGEALPPLVIGGTVFKPDAMQANGIIGAAGIQVIVYDSTGDSRVACTNETGNFYIEKTNWDSITFPLKSYVGPGAIPSHRMRSIIGREGSCANCHKLPTVDRPGTGAGQDTPGVIMVDVGDEFCPP